MARELGLILLGTSNTGCRPSEGAGLLPHHIRLYTNVPQISIEPEGRSLNSPRARRVIPLTGISLEAFRECPEGFPRYRNSPTLSDTVNKYLRENGLLPTEKHSLYSLRHSFEDRMLAARVDREIVWFQTKEDTALGLPPTPRPVNDRIRDVGRTSATFSALRQTQTLRSESMTVRYQAISGLPGLSAPRLNSPPLRRSPTAASDPFRLFGLRSCFPSCGPSAFCLPRV